MTQREIQQGFVTDRAELGERIWYCLAVENRDTEPIIAVGLA